MSYPSSYVPPERYASGFLLTFRQLRRNVTISKMSGFLGLGCIYHDVRYEDIELQGLLLNHQEVLIPVSSIEGCMP